MDTIINYHLCSEEITRYIKRLKAGVDTLSLQNQKLLNFFFPYRQLRLGHRRDTLPLRQKVKVCTIDDVRSPALYPTKTIGIIRGMFLNENNTNSHRDAMKHLRTLE